MGKKQTQEREFETGLDENFKAQSAGQHHLNYLNSKRTYDEYQSLSLDHARRVQAYAEQALATANAHLANVNQISLQILQNAVETANKVGKQAVRHSDLSIDRQWNVDEQGYTAQEILEDDSGIQNAATRKVVRRKK